MRVNFRTKISKNRIGMENIYEPNSSFSFDKLALTPPTLMSGGNYFIKFLMTGSPLYIQLPKCKTKGGISKAGKKLYTDLMFTNENVDFIKWMEDLESHVCNSIFENREKWFETDMELHDIENYFTSPMKTYKSGKFYLVRTNIPTRLGKIALTIYDEDENLIDYESVNENTNIITILEIQGIKCSARSFQMEIEVKQMMTLKPVDLFEKCIIKSNIKGKSIEEPVSDPVPLVTENITTEIDVDETIEPIVEKYEDPSLGLNDILDNDDDETVEESNETDEPINTNDLENVIQNEFTEDSLAEIELNIETVPDSESVQLKPRNDVYYEMYRAAKHKAKMAKNLALKSYLEAKNIKNTYMLDDVSDTESDDFDETDEEELLENLEKEKDLV